MRATVSFRVEVLKVRKKTGKLPHAATSGTEQEKTPESIGLTAYFF